MLLRHEETPNRRKLHEGNTELVKRKFAGLVERRQTNNITLPYGVPKEFDLGIHNGERCVVSITLLDANHCPGSAMFLITSKDKAVLHTGDVRADKVYMQQLMREPVLQEFLVPAYSPSPDPSPIRRLDRIYIDTSQSWVLLSLSLADHSQGRHPGHAPEGITVFFLNTWCWGWEEVIIAVAKAFKTRREVYQAVSTKLMEPVRTIKMGEWNLAGSDILAAAFRSTLQQASAGEIEWPTEILYSLHENFMGAVPDDAVLATQAETRAWFAASPKHGADWLMAMDLSVVDNADPPPFLGLNLNVNLNAGTNRNLGETNLHLNIGNPMSMLNALVGGPLLTNAAALFGGSTRVMPSGPASSAGLHASSRQPATSGSTSSVGRVPALTVKQEGEPMPKEVKMEIKVESEASTAKVLLPSKGPRKRRRPASKYAVDAGSLSKLIKREPAE
ncbi:hypothetical protein A1Q1_04940 [Trichosporon asahii var. asahii CBS 2479]|uniref:DNA repair metallo-beta-lactamase domain-containing protein n=1 Tax=Trichosporon asahii var. asahii (strain ATCC 90039 / CBS 2479 / JCM 2466 / KCTC 7840 / NBRC 103889/ NCYC 2677 / UAMH 7654) TaxID=1186058 RepID=J5SMG8_TRIAS|nr:hypothetical protein A1Q1_04940 [Trichosporon asahii var. asahii CBS 2479]EJT46451.1 hypothetical protein A1Q1_04940 [Trichosporon asahii var. asahii CBS 2479]